MKMCKDCLHFDVCKKYGNAVGFPVDDGVCLHFQDSTKYEAVIRCKECRFWDEDGRCDPLRNGLTEDYTMGVDYCSYGERRQEP